MKKLPTNLLAFIWHFIKMRPVPFSFFFSAPLLVVFETNIIPYSLKIVIDTIIESESYKNNIISQIKPQLWIIAISWIGSMTFLRLIHWWEAHVIPYFEADIRKSVLEYITLHSYKYFSNQLTGNISNKISDLIRAICSIIEIVSWNCISTLSVILVALVLMTTINYLFVIIFGSWVVVHLMLSFFFVKIINKSSEENANDKSILSGHIVDTISNIFLVKLLAGRDYELKRISRFQKTEINSNKRLIISMNIFQVCIYIPITIMIGSIIYFLITLWQDELISTGDFVFIFNTIFFITQQMWNLSNALANLFKSIGIAQQALVLITPEHEITDSEYALPLNVSEGRITFTNVSYSHNNNSKLFENINIEIKPNEKVGLVGFSGSGKTTFVNLLLRFFDVKAGSIKIDGQDLRSVMQDSLRNQITSISQDNDLFHRTILENLQYNKVGITKKQVEEVAKSACSHDFIRKLPKGYNSLVGERGVNLSGGQKQRVSIARAMLSSSKILILDEATSALDSVTEYRIQKELYKIMKNKTTILIAHRLSTLKNVDRILVFDEGKIIEDGTHKELLRKKGHYFILWSMQKNGKLPKISMLS